MNFPKLSKYHTVVLFIYLLLLLAVIAQFPKILVYEPTLNALALIVAGVTIVGFYLLLSFFRKGQRYPIHREPSFILCAIFYSFAFALPEEILFRGFVQGYMFSSLAPVISIFVSSLIFGFAHILNSAKDTRLINWNWRLVSVSFVAGIPLGVLYLLTGSLFLPTLVHAIFLLGFQLFLSK